MASEPTRGPACVHRNSDGSYAVVAPDTCPHSSEGDEVFIASFLTESSAHLIAAAFNASTAARDLGFDAIGAIEALPELLKVVLASEWTAIHRPTGSIPESYCQHCGHLKTIGHHVGCTFASALSAARKRGDA